MLCSFIFQTRTSRQIDILLLLQVKTQPAEPMALFSLIRQSISSPQVTTIMEWNCLWKYITTSEDKVEYEGYSKGANV